MSRRRVRIQPGGMCRTPSSRIVRDGMASESLNLASDLDETVPVLPPELAEGEDIPESWREGNGEMVFVHVRPAYEHHVYQAECEDGLVGIGTWAEDGDGWKFTPFMEMSEGETLNNIVNIGNTLIVSTSEATHYVLWKEGSYRDLGTELPKPAVQFVGGERERRGVFVSGSVTHDSMTSPQEVFDALDEEVWLALPHITATPETSTSLPTAEMCDHGFFFCGSSKYDYDKNKAEETKNARIQGIWNAYADAVAYAAKYNELDWVNGRAFYQPYLFRYALRLYDGTYAMQSVPILVGGGITWPQVLGDTELKNHDDSGHYGFAMIPMFSVRAIMEEAVSEDWGDIVTAVDIFCSSPINPYDPGDATISAISGGTFYITDFGDGFDNELKHDMPWMRPNRSNSEDRYYEVERYGLSQDQMEGVVLNHNVFYLIGSFLIDNSGFSLDEDYDPAQEFTANQEDLVAGIQLKKPDADTLVTHTSTASTDWDDYGADSIYHGNAQRVMNQRLAIWDIDETLGRGLNVLNGQSTIAGIRKDDYDVELYPESPGAYIYRFCYVLDDNGEERFVWGHTSYSPVTVEHPEIVFLPYRNIVLSNTGKDALGFLYGYSVICVPFAWLAYPDAKCRRVLLQRRKFLWFYSGAYVFDGDWGDVMSLPMKEHPFLNCAYAWLGFANAIEGAEATAEDARKFTDYYEDRLVRDVNTIMMSVASNPFSFPTGARYIFDYAVVSCAVANKPLSTGQVGDFKLYVLTKGGVWYMEMNKDGTFASSTPGPRDVAVSRKGVCEFDDGFVFITDRGVIAVQGGEFTDISQVMTGRHDPLPDSAERALRSSGFGADDVPINSLRAAWADGSAFMDFMTDATAGYDYLGDRMVFINGNFRWQWVWMRKTATWHRTMLWEGDYGLTDNGAIKIRSFVNSWPGLLANLVGADEDGDRACAVGEMTSQLDRTRDEGLSSTGMYVSRPLTFDNPDVFKSVMDLRIRGDLRRGNAKRLLLSSNNGHDWVLRTSLRGPSFKFHRIVVVTRMTTNERLSYIEVEVDDRLTNRMR